MARNYSDTRDLIESVLSDSSNAVWTAAELDLYITQALRELAHYKPYIFRGEFETETRVGTCNADSASNLTDTTKSQFLAGDALKKWLYNSTDRTWALCTARTSSSILALDKDIFDDGDEDYEVFNLGCTDVREFNIEDVFDHIGIDKIEFPINQNPPSFVSWAEQEKNIIRMDLDYRPDDTDPTLTTPGRKTIWVYFRFVHKLANLTTLAGAIDLSAGYSAGDTTIHVDGLTADDVVKKGQELTIAGLKGIYIVTADVTATGGECDLTIWPGLHDNVVNLVVVTLTGSTLDYRLEEILPYLVAGHANVNKANKYMRELATGGRDLWKNMMTAGQMQLAWAQSELRKLSPPRYKIQYSRDA